MCTMNVSGKLKDILVSKNDLLPFCVAIWQCFSVVRKCYGLIREVVGVDGGCTNTGQRQ